MSYVRVYLEKGREKVHIHTYTGFQKSDAKIQITNYGISYQN